jgi:hypothetical protein
MQFKTAVDNTNNDMVLEKEKNKQTPGRAKVSHLLTYFYSLIARDLII